MDISEFPSPVSRFSKMDPEEDAILFDGTDLRPGMIVLIDHHNLREELKVVPVGTEAEFKLLRNNRWCLVSDPRVADGRVSFIATYWDGTATKRDYDVKYAWRVKKETMQPSWRTERKQTDD